MATTGLVLEGGGMRGIFTAGVLDFFLEQNVQFDNVIGVSAGSCHACSYLAKQHGRAYATSVNYLNDKRYCSLHSFITTGDLFGAKMLYETIPLELYPIDNETFLKNPCVFQAVITNCLTGEAEYPHIKDLINDVQYIRASSSLPAVSRMVTIQNTPYLDGGIADSIPIRQSIKQGNTKNVVILTQPRTYRKSENKLLPYIKIRYKKYPRLISKIENRHIEYNNTLDFLYEQEKKGNLFIIAPNASLNIDRVEKNKEKLKVVYDIGYNEAKEHYSDMMNYLSIKQN